jgi:D-alanyl-D-alanine carboxypeptidase (penicillin-binding protein 5/6)
MSGESILKKVHQQILIISLCIIFLFSSRCVVRAEPVISTPSAILIEASTGRVIYEVNSSERRCPASITKIMTLLLAFDQIASGKISLSDEVLTSQYASSMGGSQVFLAEGESQTLDTMLKCIAVASGNDASVAVAEHIAGSEEAFVDMMNEKAANLGMTDTHFEDCCGLTDSDNHYTSAKDVAIMSRELITDYPEIFQYTKIWMEDITHVTRQGTSSFTLNSTNKLLKQYQWTTGLKTGSTSKAKYCICATASKDGIDLIAVIMGAPDVKSRFQDAKTLLSYGFSVCNLYIDENKDKLDEITVQRGVLKSVPIKYQSEFRYLDITGTNLDGIEKVVEVPDEIAAPIEQNQKAGVAKYLLNGKTIGIVPILFAKDVPAATYVDYLKKIYVFFLL